MKTEELPLKIIRESGILNFICNNVVAVEEEANAKAEAKEEEDEGKVQIGCD